MKTIMTFLLIFYSLTTLRLAAQGKGANLNNNNVVGWNNVPTNLVKEKVEYADVKGNYFWNQEWLPANVSMKNGVLYKLTKAKLNLYSNEVYYIDDKNIEIALQSKEVKSLTFYSSTDTAKIAVFKNLVQPATGKESLTQVLVNGKIQLLIKKSVVLLKQETDPLQTKMEMVFEPRETYFLNYNGSIQEMKSISKNNLFGLIEEKDGDEDWLKAQKNKLRNENDVISFLVYRNSIVE